MGIKKTDISNKLNITTGKRVADSLPINVKKTAVSPINKKIILSSNDITKSSPSNIRKGISSTSMSGASSKKMICKILMLDDSVVPFQVQHKAVGKNLWDEVTKSLNLLESDYFGLEYQDEERNKCWLDNEKLIINQVDVTREDALFKFSVKFYTPDPTQLEEEYTRYLFCLQLKRDLADGSLPCTDNTAALLASYIVQADCGDYSYDDYPDHTYLSTVKFFPKQNSELEKLIMENHKKHAGQSPAEADLNFLDIARRVEMYGIKLHPAQDHEGVKLNLAVTHAGIIVYQNNIRINTFSWVKIRKLSFKRKKFLIKLQPEEFGYYKDTVEFFFSTRNQSKNFWKKCIECHTFFRVNSNFPISVEKPTVRHKRTKLFSKGSSFRYSGRTQKEVISFVRDSINNRQPFARSISSQLSANKIGGSAILNTSSPNLSVSSALTHKSLPPKKSIIDICPTTSDIRKSLPPESLPATKSSIPSTTLGLQTTQPVKSSINVLSSSSTSSTAIIKTCVPGILAQPNGIVVKSIGMNESIRRDTMSDKRKVEPYQNGVSLTSQISYDQMRRRNTSLYENIGLTAPRSATTSVLCMYNNNNHNNLKNTGAKVEETDPSVYLNYYRKQRTSHVPVKEETGAKLRENFKWSNAYADAISIAAAYPTSEWNEVVSDLVYTRKGVEGSRKAARELMMASSMAHHHQAHQDSYRKRNNKYLNNAISDFTLATQFTDSTPPGYYRALPFGGIRYDPTTFVEEYGTNPRYERPEYQRRVLSQHYLNNRRPQQVQLDESNYLYRGTSGITNAIPESYKRELKIQSTDKIKTPSKVWKDEKIEIKTPNVMVTKIVEKEKDEVAGHSKSSRNIPYFIDADKSHVQPSNKKQYKFRGPAYTPSSRSNSSNSQNSSSSGNLSSSSSPPPRSQDANKWTGTKAHQQFSPLVKGLSSEKIRENERKLLQEDIPYVLHILPSQHPSNRSCDLYWQEGIGGGTSFDDHDYTTNPLRYPSQPTFKSIDRCNVTRYGNNRIPTTDNSGGRRIDRSLSMNTSPTQSRDHYGYYVNNMASGYMPTSRQSSAESFGCYDLDYPHQHLHQTYKMGLNDVWQPTIGTTTYMDSRNNNRQEMINDKASSISNLPFKMSMVSPSPLRKGIRSSTPSPYLTRKNDVFTVPNIPYGMPHSSVSMNQLPHHQNSFISGHITKPSGTNIGPSTPQPLRKRPNSEIRTCNTENICANGPAIPQYLPHFTFDLVRLNKLPGKSSFSSLDHTASDKLNRCPVIEHKSPLPKFGSSRGLNIWNLTPPQVRKNLGIGHHRGADNIFTDKPFNKTVFTRRFNYDEEINGDTDKDGKNENVIIDALIRSENDLRIVASKAPKLDDKYHQSTNIGKPYLQRSISNPCKMLDDLNESQLPCYLNKGFTSRQPNSHHRIEQVKQPPFTFIDEGESAKNGFSTECSQISNKHDKNVANLLDDRNETQYSKKKVYRKRRSNSRSRSTKGLNYSSQNGYFDSEYSNSSTSTPSHDLNAKTDKPINRENPFKNINNNTIAPYINNIKYKLGGVYDQIKGNDPNYISGLNSIPYEPTKYDLKSVDTKDHMLSSSAVTLSSKKSTSSQSKHKIGKKLNEDEYSNNHFEADYVTTNSITEGEGYSDITII